LGLYHNQPIRGPCDQLAILNSLLSRTTFQLWRAFNSFLLLARPSGRVEKMAHSPTFIQELRYALVRNTSPVQTGAADFPAPHHREAQRRLSLSPSVCTSQVRWRGKKRAPDFNTRRTCGHGPGAWTPRKPPTPIDELDGDHSKAMARCGFRRTGDEPDSSDNGLRRPQSRRGVTFAAKKKKVAAVPFFGAPVITRLLQGSAVLPA
jgi:hypothetical protein